MGLWLLLGLVAVSGIVAMRRGPAADFDLRNYHLYDAQALLSGRIRQDLAPAQAQTFHAPSLDILIDLLRRSLNDWPRAFVSILALPYALCVWCVWRLQCVMLLRWGRARYILHTAALWAAATGAAALPTIGTQMSEAPCIALLLGACLICIAAPDRRGLVAAGLCLGAAVGLKLTAAGPACGIALAWLLTDPTPRRWRRAALLAGSAALAVAVVAGWWWGFLWWRTGNPLFPYFNDLFGAPWLPRVRLADRRFLPRSLLQALFYPFWWAMRPSTLASELPVRDPRLAAAECVVIAAVVLLVLASLRRLRRPAWLDRRAVFVVIVWAVTYAAWALQFGVLRYLAVLEFLGGVVFVLPLRTLAPRWQMPAAAAAAVLALGASAVTVLPDWGRLGPGAAHVVDVRLPAQVPADSLVILLDPAPMAYAALALPRSAALLGANSNLVHPGDETGLARAIAARIARHAGPIYGLETPSEGGAADAATLRAHRLHRAGGCAVVHSNLDGDAMRLCPLARDP